VDLLDNDKYHRPEHSSSHNNWRKDESVPNLEHRQVASFDGVSLTS
jgi:hypothetical protein